MEYKIMVGESKGEVMDKDAAKQVVDKYIEDAYYIPHDLSFDAKGNYKDFTLKKILLKQVKKKRKDSPMVVLKANPKALLRLRERAQINCMNNFHYKRLYSR